MPGPGGECPKTLVEHARRGLDSADPDGCVRPHRTRETLVKGFAGWLGGAAFALLAGGASAQVSDNVVKIGILNDQSGVYADYGGMWSVEAAKMAGEDFGG